MSNTKIKVENDTITTMYLDMYMEPSTIIRMLTMATDETVGNFNFNRLELDAVNLQDEAVIDSVLEFFQKVTIGSTMKSSPKGWHMIELKDVWKGGNGNGGQPLAHLITGMLVTGMLEPSNVKAKMITDVSAADSTKKDIVIHQLCLQGSNAHSHNFHPIVTKSLSKGLVEAKVQLKQLVVCRTCLSDEMMAMIGKGLSMNSTLSSISFTGSHFLGKQVVRELANALVLREQSTSGSTSITTEGSVHNPRPFHTLIKLNLFSCDMHDMLVADLVTMLQIGRHPLKHLDIGKNKCGQQTLTAIGKWLETPDVQLEYINLALQTQPFDEHHEQQQQQQPGVWFDISLLSKGLTINKTLKSLILRGNKVDEGINSLIMTALLKGDKGRSNSSLTRLMLTDCELSYDTVLQCFLGYDENTNELSASSSTPRLRHLSQFKGLQRVWLDGIQHFGVRGKKKKEQLLSALRQGMQHNVVLEELYLPFGLLIGKDQDIMRMYLDLNRAGRKLMYNQHNQHGQISIPASLWPLVLERVMTMKLCSSCDSNSRLYDNLRGKNVDAIQDYDDKSSLRRRITVLYYLLRWHVLLER